MTNRRYARRRKARRHNRRAIADPITRGRAVQFRLRRAQLRVPPMP